VDIAGSHNPVVIHTANEYTQFSGILEMIHVKDDIYFLFPRLKYSRSKQVTEPVIFFTDPFTFQWVRVESVFM